MRPAAWAFAVALTSCVPSSGAAPVCRLGTVPCFVLCGHPPHLTDAQQAASKLRSSEYEKLSKFSRFSAIATTQLGKCIGINGWRNYGFQVWAIGTVDQAATSWDGLRTVDTVIANFNGRPADQLSDGPLYIRAEVIRRVWKHLDHIPQRGDYIRVQGELHWDGHGFLEIHPSKRSDLSYLPSSTNSLPQGL